MILKLDNEKNKKKFYKKIWLYKSIFYKKIKFETNDPVDIQTKYLIDGLNIKNRKERINFTYDKICEVIDKKYEGENICGFKNRICKVQQCKHKNQHLDGCCRKCLHKTPNGCPSKNIACKLFNCTAVKEKYDMYEYKDIILFKLFSLKNRIIVRHDFFTLRENVLKDLYSYSLIYSFSKMIIRIISDLIKESKIPKNNK